MVDGGDIWSQVDQIEVALMQKRPVNVFNIPPAASAQGHNSSDWRGKQIWTGSCQVMHELNKCCKVQLVNEDGSLFAQSVLTDGSTYDTHLTRAYDSTRAFALVLTSDQGQKATVGIMFPERNDSFDFIQALDNFKKAYRVEKGLDSNFQKPDAAQIEADLSLKEGEKITINFANMPNPALNKQAAQKKATGGGLKRLAPPPGFKGKPKAAVSNDLLGDIGHPADQQKPQSDPTDLLGIGSQENQPQKASADAIANLLDSKPPSQSEKYSALADLDFSSSGPAAQKQPMIEQQQLPPAQQPDNFDSLFGGSSGSELPKPAQQPPTSNLLDL